MVAYRMMTTVCHHSITGKKNIRLITYLVLLECDIISPLKQADMFEISVCRIEYIHLLKQAYMMILQVTQQRENAGSIKKVEALFWVLQSLTHKNIDSPIDN